MDRSQTLRAAYLKFVSALPELAEQCGIGCEDRPTALMIAMVASTHASVVDASPEEQEEILELLIKDVRQTFALFQASYMNAEKS